MKSTLRAIFIALVIALVWILWGSQNRDDTPAPLGSVRVAMLTSSVAQTSTQASTPLIATTKGGAIM